MFSGRRLKTEEALRIGLINRVVDAEDLEAETIAYAETLAATIPGATLVEVTPRATDADRHIGDMRQALARFLASL